MILNEDRFGHSRPLLVDLEALKVYQIFASTFKLYTLYSRSIS